MDHQRLYWSTSLFISIVLPTILFGLVGAWIVMRKNAYAKGRKPMPPGPRGLPIIGHLHLLGKLPHRSLYELSKVHGPLMSLRLGSIPVVVASSPDTARQILKQHDHAFVHRRTTIAANHLFGGPKSMVYSSANDPHWKLIRRISASELFSPKQHTRFQPLRASIARALMRSVLADCLANHTPSLVVPSSNVATLSGGSCCMRPKLLQAFNDLTMKMMTGKSLIELAGINDAARVVEILEEITNLLGTFNVSDYLPFLAWLDLQGFERRSGKAAADMREVFDRIIKARRLEAGVVKEDAYFLDILLEYASSSSTTCDISVIDNFVEFTSGGTDSSAVTIEWALAELIINPHKMHLVQAEIEEVVGRARMVKEEDIPHLPYLVASLKETMRLHPIAPLLIPHVTETPCEISNFQIPSNSEAYVNVWAIGRDPLVWESPLLFLPERFLKVDPIDMQGQHFELTPFGAGRRICPGLRLAVTSMSFILACLLQGFDWNVSPCEGIDMTEVFGINTTLKTPLVAYAKPRLSQDLYSLP